MRFKSHAVLYSLLHTWTWRMAWRDARGQASRLWLCILSIAIGIGALTAIHALRGSVQEGIDGQSKSLLGADVVVSSRRPIGKDRWDALAGLTRETASETAFSSMLSKPDASHLRMVQVRAMSGGFPFGNKVETNPPDAWQELQSTAGLFLDPALMNEFGVRRGDRLKLGSGEFQILGSVLKGVPRSSRFSGFAPEVFMREQDLEATGLVGAQSLVYYHKAAELAAKTDEGRKKAEVEIRRALENAGVQVQTPESRKESLGEGLRKASEFLGITAIIALVLGGIGVAGTMHTHLRRRIPSLAILLCLGCSSETAFAIFFAQSIAVALVGAILGSGAGAFVHAGVVHFAGGSFPVQVALFPTGALLAQSAAAGFLLCCSFALLPLLEILEVSPAATLGGRIPERARKPLLKLIVQLCLPGAVWAVARHNGSGSARAFAITAGLCVGFALLAGVALALIKAAKTAVRRHWPYVVRQGVSNLFRPQNQTLLLILSLGLGVFLLLTSWSAKTLVLNELKLGSDGSSPNIYLIDVQPDQTAGISRVLEKENLPLLEDVPMVTMRIESVKGLPLVAKENGRASKDAEGSGSVRVPRWVMEREYRSSYRATLNQTEGVVAGSWPPPPWAEGEAIPISLEQQLARDLQVRLGDEIVMDVQGVPMRTRVACVRKVDWSRFNLNFFMIFPPGVLENAPQFHVVTTRVASAAPSTGLQRALLAEAPNVSVVDLTSILATVASLLGRAAQIMEIMAAFTLAAGLPILAGVLFNGRDQRIHESVLLRTLGATENQVRAILLVEYATLGLLAALAGCMLAQAAGWAMARWIFKTPHAVELAPCLWAAVLSLGAAVATGALLSRGVCNRPPLELLRGE